MSAAVPLPSIGKAPSSTPTAKTLTGTSESFTSSYNPVTDLVTITETGNIIHIGGPVKGNKYFEMQFTSAKGNIYKVTTANVT
jgi:hypothetical protein